MNPELSLSHVSQATVSKEFVDQYGHVNYKAYPSFLEKGQDEYMEERGIGFDVIESRYNLRSFVRSMKVTYNGQLFTGDAVQINTSVSRVGNSSITYEQSIEKNGQRVIEFELVVVLVGPDDKPARIPDEIRELLFRKDPNVKEGPQGSDNDTGAIIKWLG